MIKKTYEKIVSYDMDLLFDIIKDVDSYKEFLPWIVSSKTSEHKKGFFVGNLVIAYKGVNISYDSRVIYDADQKLIKSLAISGPFKSLKSEWLLTPENNQTHIRLNLQVSFSNIIYETLLLPFLDQNTMIEAFERRAYIKLTGSTST